MTFDLSGRVAVVTGALGRLGPVWCEALVSAGATVAGLDLPGTEPDGRWRALEQRWGGRLTVHRADVRDRSSLDQAAGVIERAAGPVTILVNNAGIDQPPAATTTYTIETIPPGVFRDILDVNVVGAFQVIQAFGPGMIRAGRGSIINIGSLYAAVSPDQRFYDHLPVDPPFLKPPAYGVSKAGLVNLTRYLAAHWGRYGVRVNTLSPGGVLGGQDEEFKRKFNGRVPMGRMATGDDLKGPLVFLASDASSYVTGIDLRVDGGYTAW
jgi:NAD(P)-dependent dehydrogenase (short-subunit alcohol dehydrogenase family)